MTPSKEVMFWEIFFGLICATGLAVGACDNKIGKKN